MVQSYDLNSTMRKISNLLAALVFVSLVIFISCGGDDGGGTPDPLTQRAAELQDTWTVTEVRLDGGTNLDADWVASGFSLTITGASAAGGSYAVSNVPPGFEVVWPSSNTTWTFNDNDVDELLRGDGVVMAVSGLTGTTLTLTFNITTQAARTSGIAGAWTFIFSGT